jgi:hypothetical protein
MTSVKNSIFAISVVAHFSVSASAAINTPPGLQAGEKFHLVFVTSGSTQAFTSNPPISGYDTFVFNEAALNGLTTYDASFVDWYALGSFSQFAGPDVSAISRFNPSFPVYRLDGVKIANDGADLWDGTIQNLLNVAPDLSTVNAIVWTGSEVNGSPAINNATLNNGLNNPRAGANLSTSSLWISGTDFPYSTESHLYAFSSELTVIPEPGTTVLAMIALTAAVGFRRRLRNERVHCEPAQG